MAQLKDCYRDELARELDALLETQRFQDYGPNGLQIEGTEKIERIAFAVSGTADSVAQAVEKKADALIVHHGLFWKFHGIRPLTGPFAKRVLPLVRNHINLFGYHLPLDAHPEVGNAAMIAKKLRMTSLLPYGDHKGEATGLRGTFPSSLSVAELQTRLKEILNHQVLLSSSNPDEKIDSLAIITGGANGDWIHCLKTNTQCYLTGEMSEHDWHEAKESGIHMFAGGHHATEQFGVLALKEWIEQRYRVETIVIDSDNPA